MPIRRRQTGPGESFSLINTDLQRLKRKSRTAEKILPRPPASKVDPNKCSAHSLMSTQMESSNWNQSQNIFHGTSSGLSHEISQWDQWSWGLGYSTQSNGHPEIAQVNGATANLYYSEENNFNPYYNSSNGSTEKTAFNQGYCEHKGASVSEVSQFDGIYHYHCFNCGNYGYYNQFGNVQYDQATKSFKPVAEVAHMENGVNGAETANCESNEKSNNAVTPVSHEEQKIAESYTAEAFETATVENQMVECVQSNLQAFELTEEDVNLVPEQTVPSSISNCVDMSSMVNSSTEINREFSELEANQMTCTASDPNLDYSENEVDISGPLLCQNQGKGNLEIKSHIDFDQQWFQNYNHGWDVPHWNEDFEMEAANHQDQNSDENEKTLVFSNDQSESQYSELSNFETENTKVAENNFYQNDIPNGISIDQENSVFLNTQKVTPNPWNNEFATLPNGSDAENSNSIISHEQNEENSLDTRQRDSYVAPNDNSNTLINGTTDQPWPQHDWNLWANNLETGWDDTPENGGLESVSTNDLSAAYNTQQEDAYDRPASNSLDFNTENENCVVDGSFDFTARESEGSSDDQNVDEQENLRPKSEIASDEQSRDVVPVELTVHDCICMYAECLQNCRTVTDVYNERIWRAHANDCPMLLQCVNEISNENETGEFANSQDHLDSCVSANVDPLEIRSISDEREENEGIVVQNYEDLVDEDIDVVFDQKKDSNEVVFTNEVQSFRELEDTTENEIVYGNYDEDTIASDSQRWDASPWNEDLETEVVELEVQAAFVEEERTLVSIATENFSPSDQVGDQNLNECLRSEKHSEEFGHKEDNVIESRGIEKESFSEPTWDQQGWDTTWNEQLEENDWENTWSKSDEPIKPNSESNQNEEPNSILMIEESGGAVAAANREEPEMNHFKEIDFDSLEENNNWDFSEWKDMPVSDEKPKDVDKEDNEDETEQDLVIGVRKVDELISEEPTVTEKLQEAPSILETSEGGWNNDGWECSFEENYFMRNDEMESFSKKEENVQVMTEVDLENGQCDVEEAVEHTQPEEPILVDDICVDTTDGDIENSKQEVGSHAQTDLEIRKQSQFGDTNIELTEVVNFDSGNTKMDEVFLKYSNGNEGNNDKEWDENEWGWGWDNEELVNLPQEKENETKTPTGKEIQREQTKFDDTNSISEQLTHSNNSESQDETQEAEEESVGCVEPVTPPAKTVTEVKEDCKKPKPVSSAVETVKLIDVKCLKVSPSYALRKSGNSRGKIWTSETTEDYRLGKLDLSNVCNLENIPSVSEAEVRRSNSPDLCSTIPVLDHRAVNPKPGSFSFSSNSAVDRSKLSKATKVDILPDRAKLNSSSAFSVDLEEPKSSLVSSQGETPAEIPQKDNVEEVSENHHVNCNIVNYGSLSSNNFYSVSDNPEIQSDFSEKNMVTDGQSIQEDHSTTAESNLVSKETDESNAEVVNDVQNIPGNISTHNLIDGQTGYVESNTPPGNASFTSESTIHSVPNLNRSFPLYHQPQMALNVEPYYNQNIVNPYSTPEANQTPLGMGSYPMASPFNMHFAAFEQMRMLNWQHMQYKLYMDQLYVYMNKQKRVSSKLKQSQNRRSRAKRTTYDSSYTEDTATDSMMGSEKDAFTELETSSVETDAVDSVEHTKEQPARFHLGETGPQLYGMSRRNFGRKPRGCVARFSANGKFVFTDNLNANKSQIFLTSKVDPQPKVFTAFPGPLGRDRTHKLAVKEYLLKRLDEASVCGNKDLMTVLNYLVLLVKQNGAICGTDISEILLNEQSQEGSDVEIEGSVMDLPEVSMASSRMTKMNVYASSGKDSHLIRCASESNSWGMALRLASLAHNKELERQVFDSFDNKCHPESTVDPMITFLLIKEKRKFPECFLKNCWRNWREHVAVVLSNPTNNQEYDKMCFEVIGDALAAKGFDIPSQFCYILACLPLSLPWEPSARFVLLGSSAKSSFDMMNDYGSILLTLIFEYAVHLGNQEVCFPSLQFFKFRLSKKMVECGIKSKAIDYCLDTCAEVLANHIHFPTSFLNELRNLTYQLSPGRNEQDEETLGFFLDQLDYLIDSRGTDNFPVHSDNSRHSSNSNLVYDEGDSEAFPPKTPVPNLTSLKISKPLGSFIEDISDSITLEPGVANMDVVDSPIDTIQVPFNVAGPLVVQQPSQPVASKSSDPHNNYYEQPEATCLETVAAVVDNGPSVVDESSKSQIPLDVPYNLNLPNHENCTQPIPDKLSCSHHATIPLFVSNSASQSFYTEPPPVSPKLKPRSFAKSNSSLNESDGHPGFSRRKRDKSFRDSVCSEASETSIFELSGSRSRQTGYSNKAIHRAAERTQSVNSIDSCKSLKYNTVIPETKDETGDSNVSRNETPVNEPKDIVSKTKTETKQESTSWIFNGMKTVLGKIIPLPGNQMHLPDDRSSDFYWDPEKKKWIDKTNDGKEEEVPLPPPAAAMMGNAIPSNGPIVPGTLSPLQENGTSTSPKAPVPPNGLEKPPQPLGNPFARGKSLMRNKYVDVLASSNQVSSSSVPQLPAMLPPSAFPTTFDANMAR